MPLPVLLLVVAALGALLAAFAAAGMRAAGARPAMGRRLAGPPEVRVGSILDTTDLPSRPVRVAGRVRCTDPIVTPDGERLVAFHRDVEVRIGGRWHALERTRETRSFELWDHAGSLEVDPTRASEPLITIPGVWRGMPNELDEPHRSAAARLAERVGPIAEARAVTRSIALPDRLLVLALARRDPAGRVRLEPPSGGYLITNLPLSDAMRLLGGRHRRLLVASVIALVTGVALVLIGLLGALVTALAGT
jgi:hypothetical protein